MIVTEQDTDYLHEYADDVATAWRNDVFALWGPTSILEQSKMDTASLSYDIDEWTVQLQWAGDDQLYHDIQQHTNGAEGAYLYFRGQDRVWASQMAAGEHTVEATVGEKPVFTATIHVYEVVPVDQ